MLECHPATNLRVYMLPPNRTCNYMVTPEYFSKEDNFYRQKFNFLIFDSLQNQSYSRRKEFAPGGMCDNMNRANYTKWWLKAYMNSNGHILDCTYCRLVMVLSFSLQFPHIQSFTRVYSIVPDFFFSAKKCWYFFFFFFYFSVGSSNEYPQNMFS